MRRQNSFRRPTTSDSALPSRRTFTAKAKNDHKRLLGVQINRVSSQDESDSDCISIGDSDDEIYIPPPLPLLSFLPHNATAPVANILGDVLHNVDYTKIISEHTTSADVSVERATDEISHPLAAIRYLDWYELRCEKEIMLKRAEHQLNCSFNAMDSQQKVTNEFDGTTTSVPRVREKVVYRSKLHVSQSGNSYDRATKSSSTTSGSDTIATDSSSSSNDSTPSLVFDSEYESGNIGQAARIYGRDKVLNARHLETFQPYNIPDSVTQEYDVTIRNDINTLGNIQWYYFSAETIDFSKVSSTSSSSSNSSQYDSSCGSIVYPLRVRFNITNFQKDDSQYNYGMKPSILSLARGGDGWTHGGEDICYYRNCLLQSHGKKCKKRYTLSFVYTFTCPDKVYFSHCFPYTYTDLQTYLASLQANENVSQYFNRSLLATTVGGNRCDLLTITSRSNCAEDINRKRAIIISARVHPGTYLSTYLSMYYYSYQ